jgi:hypothetical protein
MCPHLRPCVVHLAVRIATLDVVLVVAPLSVCISSRVASTRLSRAGAALLWVEASSAEAEERGGGAEDSAAKVSGEGGGGEASAAE